MPVFGNRVVVATANAKHIKKFNEEMNAREDALAEWKVQRKERKEKLEILQEHINVSRRNSAVSELSSKAEKETESEDKAQDKSAADEEEEKTERLGFKSCSYQQHTFFSCRP